MFVDASALCAILLGEPEGEDFKRRIVDAAEPITSPIAAFEAALALNRERSRALEEAFNRTEALLDLGRVTTVPITPEIGRLAIEARARYGKGTGHPAQLNMGDCFAYACARAHGVSLLYKGDDFIHTDLA
ncbi:type II toxin-antitoxin system VapC family toxin [Hansschlegelia zhihuaiae]|uniref:Ribonuclease VapC n=1 Tax=Hansschlegelia zhihuaiae TaxID=405005 RepID=A0A4Q0MJ04_9HYPH|nr:type II toxin-antitoxin system VapC family toxin [Hansschlegelia zhihuaiae]RXF73039.1 type II toxin-antitoxin system VapC family toxin [Hansschlegelia zhihuaiae]